MFAHPSAFVSTFHFFNLLFKIEQRLQGLRPLYWSKLLSLSIFTFICHGCNASIKTRGHWFWPRGFRNLSSFATSLLCQQFAQIGRSDLLGGLPACLRMPCLMHGWGLPMRGGLPPLWGGSFLPTWADIPPHTWEISLTRKTGHPLQAGAPLSRSQRTSRATCWHQQA